MAPYERWWLDRMAATRFPLEEKLTLHWHDHFATAFAKVRRPKADGAPEPAAARPRRRQLPGAGQGHHRRRGHALLARREHQPAGHPNENYGREFMELFTLGRDRYTQDDVREAARAFTGYTVDGQGKALYHPELHDAGEKTILGQTGSWGPADVADHRPRPPSRGRRWPPATWRPPGRGSSTTPIPSRRSSRPWPTPSPAAGYEIKAMVRALLLRPEFTDGPGHTIKPPAEFVAGTMRLLRLTGAPDAEQAAQPQRARRDRLGLRRHGPGAVRPARRVGLEGRGRLGQHRHHPGPLQLLRPHRQARHRRRRAHRAGHSPAASPGDTAPVDAPARAAGAAPLHPGVARPRTSTPPWRPGPTRAPAPGGSSRSCWPLPTST